MDLRAPEYSGDLTISTIPKENNLQSHHTSTTEMHSVLLPKWISKRRAKKLRLILESTNDTLQQLTTPGVQAAQLQLIPFEEQRPFDPRLSNPIDPIYSSPRQFGWNSDSQIAATGFSDMQLHNSRQFYGYDELASNYIYSSNILNMSNYYQLENRILRQSGLTIMTASQVDITSHENAGDTIYNEILNYDRSLIIDNQETSQLQSASEPTMTHFDEPWSTQQVLEDTPPQQAASGNDHIESSDTSIDPPPYEFDEEQESPTYLEKLHKRSDLLSFDPRYKVPILRINPRLVSTREKFNTALLKLVQLNIIPRNIDLWNIIYFEDPQFFKFMPRLLENYHDPELIRDLWEIERLEAGDRYRDELARAIAISLEEYNRKLMLKGFRFRFEREVVPVIRY